MDRKGQSALEYLMTYGWALIVIAIVIGVLIFVTSGATGGVTCQSQSTGLIVTEWAVTQDSVGLTLRNATGGNIVPTLATGNTVFQSDTNEDPMYESGTTSTTVTKNKTFTVTGIDGPDAGTFSDGTVTIEYTTQGGLDASATIVCAGTV